MTTILAGGCGFLSIPPASQMFLPDSEPVLLFPELEVHTLPPALHGAAFPIA